MQWFKFRYHFILISLSLLFAGETSAQFSLSAELRPRFEYRHGFGKLVFADDEPDVFVSQRSRLNLNYKHDNIRFGLSIQDVRVWGDMPQLAASSGSVMFHQAWGEYLFNEQLSVKFGRQELVYDDARIFGNVDWAQQGRAHDLLLVKFEGNSKIHIGLAFNQHREPAAGTSYSLPGYKSMQFLWFNHNFETTGLSFLVLNNGIQHNYSQNNNELFKTVYSHTIGGRLTQKAGAWTMHAEGYYTTGKDGNDNDMDAKLYKLGGRYAFDSGFGLLAGWEYLSGTSQEENPQAAGFVNRSFNPFYGTNHKFNGHMDYFYVGNHINSVGLSDIHAGVFYSRNKFSTNVTAHFFSAAANVLDTQAAVMDKTLGTELDFSINYKLADQLTLTTGYSQMFGTETLQRLRGGDHQATNNWAWMMLTFKPSFL
jgi:hypothetical protein